MAKNYEENPEKAKYLKEQLKQRYPDIFEKYKIKDLSEVQVCNLAEFLIAEHPEKYAKTIGTEKDYRSSDDLKKIYAVITKVEGKKGKQADMAIMINTNKNGKIPEGEFGVYDLELNRFKLTNEKMKQHIKDRVKKMSNRTLDAKEEEEMIRKVMPKTLEDMNRLATVEMEIESRVYKAIDKKIDAKNERNGRTKAERDNAEKESKQKNAPNEVRDFNRGQVIRYFYVNATELSERVDEAKVRRNGGRVLMVEVANGSVSGPNRYFAFQKGKMVLWGNDDKDVKDVVGNVSKMGQVVKPLKMQKAEYIEFRDENGICVNERIDDKNNLSVEERRQFKKNMEEDLRQYSKEISQILADKDLSPEELQEKLKDVDDSFDKQTSQKGKKYDVSVSDTRNINRQTDPDEISKGREKQIGPREGHGYYDDEI